MTIASGWMIRPAGLGPGGITTTPVGKLGPKGGPGNHDPYFNPFCDIVQCAKARRRKEKAEKTNDFSSSLEDIMKNLAVSRRLFTTGARRHGGAFDFFPIGNPSIIPGFSIGWKRAKLEASPCLSVSVVNELGGGRSPR
jgi:hypothetical protein